MKYENDDFEKDWDVLLEWGICEQTLRTVCNICGWTVESLEGILYANFGYQGFEQLN